MQDLEQKKIFICANADILDVKTKQTILKIIMMEVGGDVVMEKASKDEKETNIDMDAVGRASEDVVHTIYNIVMTRRAALNQPAGADMKSS